MRPTASLFALAFLSAALPCAARAQEERPPRVERAPAPAPDARAPEPRPQAEPSRGAPGPYPRTAPAPYYGPRAYPRPYYYRPHFWWGWGWGWGWYPFYGYPVSPLPATGEYAPRPGDEANRIFTRFSLYGAGRSDGYVAGVDFGIDGRYTGFDLDVNAIARESVTGPLHETGSDAATWGTAHFTWSFLSERSVRLRAETGVSMLSLPDSQFAAAQEWRGKTVFGPDVGVSGQVGLIGPLGIEGHARLTPFPVRVADTLIAATVHGGPVGLSAGWRWIDVAGDGKDAPKLVFRGPQVGLSFAF
jgi:hypothetical protein